MTLTLSGRIPSKKNSRRHFMVGGRRVVVPSQAYETWHTEWVLRLRSQRPTTPLTGSLTLTLHLHLKGRIDQDLDNAVASVLDLFQDAGIIDNDRHITELHLYKHSGAPDFSATVAVHSA